MGWGSGRCGVCCGSKLGIGGSVVYFGVLGLGKWWGWMLSISWGVHEGIWLGGEY